MLTYLLSIVSAYRSEITYLERLYRDWQNVAEKRLSLFRQTSLKLDRYRNQETRRNNAEQNLKDRLYDLINSEEEANWEFVLRYLRVSINLWDSLDYHYKGKELCNTIAANYAGLADSQPRQAHKRIDRYRRLENVARHLATSYYEREYRWKQGK